MYDRDSGLVSTYFAVPLRINEQIFWLQIPIHEIQIMQVFKTQNYLRCIEPGMTFAVIMKENHSSKYTRQQLEYQQLTHKTVANIKNTTPWKTLK